MGRIKHDHIKLIEIWLSRKYKTITDMAKGENISYSVLTKLLKKIQTDISPTKLGTLARASDIANLALAERLVRAVESHEKLGRDMVNKVQTALTSITINTATELTQMAKAGVDIQRQSMGLKSEDEKITAIQINFTCGPIKLGNEILGDSIKVVEVKDVTDKEIKNGNN